MGISIFTDDPDKFAAFLDDFFQLLDAIEASAKIYIAAVNGVCVAGGIELLLACDLAIAAASARIGDGHLNFGQLPGAGGSQRLPRAIGLLRAKHLILTGALLSAAEAERIGLVNEVVRRRRTGRRGRKTDRASCRKKPRRSARQQSILRT